MGNLRFLFSISIGSVVLLTGCVDQNLFTPLPKSPLEIAQIGLPIVPIVPPSPTPIPSNVVCDPFGPSTGGLSAQNGLLASLTYLPQTSSEVVNFIAGMGPLSVESFFPVSPDVVLEPTPIVLNQINVPTTGFSQGFQDGQGKTLSDLTGAALIEYFSLHIDAQVMLNPGDTEGDYQFGVLSDDGSIMSIENVGAKSYSELINNNGTHPNLLACADRYGRSQTLHLKKNVAIPIHVDYFQGPKFSISLVLVWRLNPASLADSECGIARDDNYFFNTAVVPSAPKAPYASLLSRGWSVVPANNLYLPAGVGSNPCN